MDNTNNRFLHLGGGLVAVLALFFMSGCPGPGNGNDSGTDAGPMPDDGGLPPPDAGPPPADGGSPDSDAGPDYDGGVPDPDGGGMTCTPEMMLNRVSPPCEPDLPADIPLDVAQAAADLPAACWDTMNFLPWSTVSGGGGVTQIRRIDPPMNLIELYFGAGDAPGTVPFNGNFRYGRGGIFYANEKNAAVPGDQGNHARLTVYAICDLARVDIFYGGNTTEIPDYSYTAWLM